MLKNSNKKQIHADASDSEADEDDKFQRAPEEEFDAQDEAKFG